MLQLAMTYEIVTPESAEDGEAAETGFVFECCDHGARELAHYITHHEAQKVSSR